MNAREKRIKVLATIGLLLAAITWGFGFIVVKNSLDLIPVSYLLGFRFTVAAIGLAIIFHKKLKNLNKTVIINSMVLGCFLFLGYFLQTIGCNYTTAGKNAFLTTIYVVIVPFLNWAIQKKKPDHYCLIAAVLAIAGIGLLSLKENLTINFGDLLTLTCGFGYAFHMIYIDKYTETQDPIVLTIFQILTAGILSWISAPIMGEKLPVEAFRPDMIFSMLYLGLFATMMAFCLQNVCQKYTAPSTAALLLSMESVFGVIFAAIFLGEYLTGRMIIGCALIFAAIIMAETKFEFLTKYFKISHWQKSQE